MKVVPLECGSIPPASSNFISSHFSHMNKRILVVYYSNESFTPSPDKDGHIDIKMR